MLAPWKKSYDQPQFSSAQYSRSVMSNSLRPYGPQHARSPCASPTPGAYANSCPLSPSNHLILCHPLLLPPSIFPSIRVFSNESVLHIRWPEYWSFSFSISPSNEQASLIAQLVKNPPAIQETPVRFLGQEDLLEKR